MKVCKLAIQTNIYQQSMTLTLKVTKYNVYDKRKMSIINVQCI